MTLLDEVIAATKNGQQELRDYRKAGLLKPQQQSAFCKGLDVVEGSVHVYREYKPLRDEIEYTIFFRRGSDGLKYRIDFEIDHSDHELLEGLTHGNLESAIAVTARAFARQAIRENRLATKAIDGYGR
jgi:hypothetical protein